MLRASLQECGFEKKQAPVEVPNILYFYEEIKDKYSHITFVSRDTNSFNDFFQLLGLKGDYIHWENNHNFDSLKPWTWRNFRKQINGYCCIVLCEK